MNVDQNSMSGSHCDKWCWENWLSICGRMRLDSYLSPYTKTNSKWIKDLEIRTKTMQLLQENIRSTPQHIGTGNDFLNGTLKAQEIMQELTNGMIPT